MTEIENYRPDVFETIPMLKYLDGFDACAPDPIFCDPPDALRAAARHAFPDCVAFCRLRLLSVICTPIASCVCERSRADFRVRLAPEFFLDRFRALSHRLRSDDVEKPEDDEDEDDEGDEDILSSEGARRATRRTRTHAAMRLVMHLDAACRPLWREHARARLW